MPTYEPYCKLPDSLDAFTRAYLETAEFADVPDDDRQAFQSADEAAWDDAAIARAKSDCERFLEQAGQHLSLVNLESGRAAHDFWLTRNRHGAGFWDGDYPTAIGKALTDIAHAFGEVWVTCEVTNAAGDGRIATLSMY